MSQYPVCAADLIHQSRALRCHQVLPRLCLPLDQRFDDFMEPSNDLIFLLSQGGLIRHLEKISHGLSAFTVEPADGQPDLIYRIDHLVDLFAQD